MYKILQSYGNFTAIEKNNGDGNYLIIPKDPANTDYQAYLAWIAEGNTPEPAEEQ